MKRRKQKILLDVIFIAFMFAVLLTSTAAGATVTVPDDYSTIQVAINVAGPSDTVYVRAGTYSPSTNGEVFPINMRNGISLVGAGADVCILDAEYTSSVIYCNGITDTTTIIEGFSIINGEKYYDIGDLGIGGGIVCQFDSSPIIINNTFTGNSAEYSSGITCDSGSNPIITKNIITGNFTRAGAGIFCIGTSPTITNNIITGNSAVYGGGIVGWSGSSPTITNNTVSGNSAEFGGGILAGEPGTIITNNIITGNSGLWEMGGGVVGESGPGVTITYNDVWDNSPFDYYDCVPGVGCISVDPSFVDPTVGDYHLEPESLCIDAGDNIAPGLPDFDFDGNPRILDGDGDGTPVVDMGAFEYQALIEVTIDIKPFSRRNTIILRKWGIISVAILSTEDFDATNDIDMSLLTFGRTGDEESLAYYRKWWHWDVNYDGLRDQTCYFWTRKTGFEVGDKEGILKGLTKDGVPIEGRDKVKIVNLWCWWRR